MIRNQHNLNHNFPQNLKKAQNLEKSIEFFTKSFFPEKPPRQLCNNAKIIKIAFRSWKLSDFEYFYCCLRHIENNRNISSEYELTTFYVECHLSWPVLDGAPCTWIFACFFCTVLTACALFTLSHARMHDTCLPLHCVTRVTRAHRGASIHWLHTWSTHVQQWAHTHTRIHWTHAHTWTHMHSRSHTHTHRQTNKQRDTFRMTSFSIDCKKSTIDFFEKLITHFQNSFMPSFRIMLTFDSAKRRCRALARLKCKSRRCVTNKQTNKQRIFSPQSEN